MEYRVSMKKGDTAEVVSIDSEDYFDTIRAMVGVMREHRDISTLILTHSDKGLFVVVSRVAGKISAYMSGESLLELLTPEETSESKLPRPMTLSASKIYQLGQSEKKN